MNDLELENGYRLAFDNAQKLIDEADILDGFDLYPRAYALYQLSIEEIGKCSILYRAILDYFMGTLITIDYLNKLGFFDHKTKTRESMISEILVIERFERSIGQDSGLKEEIADEYRNVKESNMKKNQSLYVDLVDDKFVSPVSMITKQMVEGIKLKARIRYKAIEPLLKPLCEMKNIAIELKTILCDPEKIKEMEKKYAR